MNLRCSLGNARQAILHEVDYPRLSVDGLGPRLALNTARPSMDPRLVPGATTLCSTASTDYNGSAKAGHFCPVHLSLAITNPLIPDIGIPDAGGSGWFPSTKNSLAISDS